MRETNLSAMISLLIMRVDMAYILLVSESHLVSA